METGALPSAGMGIEFERSNTLITRAVSSEIRASRWILVVALLAAFLLTVGAAVRTVHAGGEVVPLTGGVGTNSANPWKTGPIGCDPAAPQAPGAGMVMWAFWLQDVSPPYFGPPPLSLSVTFLGDGTLPLVSGSTTDGVTHYFFAYTTGDDTVTAGSVSVPNQAGALSLIDICQGPAPTPAASLPNAATGPTRSGAPGLVFFGILLAALGCLAGMRVVLSRAQR